MKKFNKNKQKGITLLELIIAMSIGLILIIALATLMIASNRSSAQRTLTEIIDENARQLFNKLGNDIMMAGYVDSWASKNRVDNSAAGGDENVARFAKMRKLSGLEGTTGGSTSSTTDAIRKYTMLGYMSNGKLLPVYGCGKEMKSNETRCSSQQPTDQQSIRLSYEVVSPQASGTPLPYGSLSTAAQEDATASDAAGTCRGESLNNSSAANFSVISNTFFIGKVTGEKDSNNNDILSLKCNSRRYALDGTNEKPQDPTESSERSDEAPLLQNVDQLVFRYIVTSENNADEMKIRNSTVEARNSKAYFTSAEVEDTAKNPLGWSAVTGVEVCAVIGIERTNDQIKTEQVTGDLEEVQRIIPSCLREASNESTAAFQPGKARGANDDKYYKRYVRTFNIGNNLNLPMVSLDKVRASAK